MSDTSELADSNEAPDIATVMPYYNDQEIAPEGREIPETIDGEDLYDTFWSIALENDPDMVLIFSWNEYFESAAIEPTKEFQDTFLESTKDWAETFKGDEIEDGVEG